MKRERRLLKNSFILGFGTIVPKMANLITIPIVTAFLTKAEYGSYDLITVLVSLLLPIATLQLQAAAFRFLVGARGDRERTSEIITNILYFELLISILLLIALFFVLKLEILIRFLVIGYYLIDILLITNRQILRGLNKNIAYSLSVMMGAFVEMILVFVFLMELQWGLLGVLLALLISHFVALLYTIISSKLLSYIAFNKVSWMQIKEMLAYSWPLVPNSLASWIMSLSDRVVLTFFMGIEITAIYSVATKIPNLFNIVQSTFTLAWQENATEASEDLDAAKYYENVFDAIFRILVGIMALLIAATPILFKILIKGDYNESYYQIPILLMGAFWGSISAYVGGIYVAKMHSKEIGITTIMAALLNIAINICLVNTIGIYAASLSTVISYMFLAIFRMIDVQKIQKIHFRWWKIIGIFIILSVMCVGCFQKCIVVDLLNGIVAVAISFSLNWNLLSAFKKAVGTKINSCK